MLNKTLDYLQKLLRTDIRYLIKGYFWFGIEYFVGSIVGLATSVAFANLVAPETYGTFKYILTILSFLTLATLKRLNDSLTISVAKGFEGDIFRILKTKMKWGLIGSLAGIILSTYYFYQSNTALGALILITAAIVPFIETPYVFSNYLVGKRNFKTLSIINSLISFFYAVGIIYTLFTYKNIFVITVLYFLINFLLRLIALFYVFNKYKPNKKRESQTISYGKKISYLGILNTTAAYIDNIFVFNYLGAIELAAYAFIKKMPEQLKDLLTFLTPLSTPKFATKKISDPYIKKESLRKSIFLSISFLLIILVYILAAPFLFKLLFPVYKEYTFLSQIYALSLPIGAFGTLLLNFIESTRQTKILVKFNIIFSISKMIIMLLAVKYYGLFGLIWAFVLIRILNPALITYYFLKEAK